VARPGSPGRPAACFRPSCYPLGRHASQSIRCLAQRVAWHQLGGGHEQTLEGLVAQQNRPPARRRPGVGQGAQEVLRSRRPTHSPGSGVNSPDAATRRQQPGGRSSRISGLPTDFFRGSVRCHSCPFHCHWLLSRSLTASKRRRTTSSASSKTNWVSPRGRRRGLSRRSVVWGRFCAGGSGCRWLSLRTGTQDA